MTIYNFEDNNKDRNFALIPDGIYDAHIEAIEERVARSNNHYKQVTFRLFGPRAEKAKVNNRLIWDNLVLLQQVEWKIQNLLYACGLPYEGTVTLSDGWNELVGKELKLGIGSREYQGQKRNDVKNFYTKTTKFQSPFEEASSGEEDIPVVEDEKKTEKELSKKKKPSSSKKKKKEEEININDIPF